MKFSYPSGSRPLDGYTIKRGIGIGGFGEVYFALNDAGKEVALKKIQRNLDIELRGVRQCMNLKHVNLISLWDIRRNDDGESWVVMEYVPGPSLRDVVEANPQGLPADELKLWFASTASGVAYLHEHGIVHRDLKPGNIFCDQHEQVIKIGDYGLSKFISCSRRSGHTESVGTFHYMAPEIGKGVYGKEIDIYALGIILFEILTGTVPFEGESTQEIIMKHLTAEPNLDGVPREFRHVIERALKKDPEQRFRSVQELVAELPWPELASHSHSIVSHNAVGRIKIPGVQSIGASGAIGLNQGNSNQPSQLTQNLQLSFQRHIDHPNVIRQTEHHGQSSIQFPAASDPGSSLPTANVPLGGPTAVPTGVVEHLHKLPPVIINGDELDAGILFGPLNDQNQTPRPADFTADKTEDPIQVLRYRGSAYPTITDLPPAPAATNQDSKQTVVGAGNQTLASEPIANEPIAQVVGKWFELAEQWFSRANLSTPIKMGLFIVAGIVVINNSRWLLPLTLATTALYLTYVLARSVWLSRSRRQESHYISPAEQLQLRNEHVRYWLSNRPMLDRLTDTVGALLVAALAAIVLNLLGLSLNGGVLERTLETWANYAWLTTLCVMASWTLILLGKVWELQSGHALRRRAILFAVGVVFGGVAFFSASPLNVDLAAIAYEDFATVGTLSYVWDVVPTLVAFILFFAGFFGLQRWWLHTDPLRPTRLSVWGVTASIVYATIACHLFNVPLLGACKVAAIVAVATQLATPWLAQKEREAIFQEVTCLDGKRSMVDDAGM